MQQDYKVTGRAKGNEQENHIYTMSRSRACDYARMMSAGGRWERVSIWKDGKEYLVNELESMP